MSFNVGTAIGYLDLDTSKFTKGFKSALGDLETFSKSTTGISGKLTSLGSAFTSVGSSLTKNVTVPLAGAGVAVVATASSFESAMSEVQAISGATGKDFEALTDKAKEMGAKTKFSASESAAALKYMAMAGWDTESMLDGLEGVMQLAAASGEDLATTSDIVTDAMTAFGLSADQSTRFADVLAKTSSSANTNVALMGETFKYVAPVAGAMGYNIEDASVAIGLMANSGIKGSQAGTSLKNMLTNLAKPTDQVARYMEKLNISLTDQAGNVKPLNQLLLDMRGSFAELTDAQKAEYAAGIAGKEGMSGLLAIVNSSQADFDKLTDAINNSSGAAEKTATTMQNNLGGQLTILKSTLEGIAIAFGDLLLPAIKQFAGKLQDLLNWVNNLSDSQKELIVKIAAMAAAIGPVLMVSGKLLTTLGKLPATLGAAKSAFGVVSGAIGAIGAPVIAVVAAIGVLVAAFKTLWDTNEEFRNTITSIWQGIKSMFTKFLSQITEKINSLGFNFKSFGEMLKALWQGLCNFLAPIFIGVFQFISDTLQTILDAILGVVDFFIAVFKGDWEGAWDAVKGIFESVWNGIARWFKNITDTIIGVARTVLSWFGVEWNTSTEEVGNTFKKVWQSVADFFTKLWNGVKTFFTNLVQSIWDKIKPLFEEIAGAFKMAWDVIKLIWGYAQPFFAAIWEGIKAVFAVVKGVLSGNFTDAWNAIKNLWDKVVAYFSTLWNGVTNVFGAVVSFFRNTFSAAWEAVKKVFGNFGTFFSNLWNTISRTFTNLGTTIGNAIGQAVKSGINGVIGMIENTINGFIGLINGAVNLINEIPGVSISKIKKLSFPRLAKGGVITEPTFAEIGEDGAEAVVPLEKNLGWMKNLVSEFMDSFAEFFNKQLRLAEKLEDIRSLCQSMLDVSRALVTTDSEYTPYGNPYVTANVVKRQGNSDHPPESKGDIYNFYSPKAIDEIEAAKQIKRTKRALAEGF